MAEEDIFEHIDVILMYLIANRWGCTLENIVAGVKEKKKIDIESSTVELYLISLEGMKLVSRILNAEKNDVYFPTAKGMKAFKFSKYVKLKGEKDKIKKNREALKDANIQSVINTNKSIIKMNDVILPANLAIQNRIGKRTLWAIGLTAFFSFITIISDIVLRDTQTPQEMHSQALSLGSLKQSLQKIDSSLKSISKDTIVVKIRK